MRKTPVEVVALGVCALVLGVCAVVLGCVAVGLGARAVVFALGAGSPLGGLIGLGGCAGRAQARRHRQYDNPA
jgi:hypothetical protein